MKNPLKYNNIVAILKELNRTRLETDALGKLEPTQHSLPRCEKKRYSYTGLELATANTHASSTADPPLASIIVVGYNGARHIPRLPAGPSNAQSYRSIKSSVDNASSDDSVCSGISPSAEAKVVKKRHQHWLRRRQQHRHGSANGEYILLLNNDARIDDNAVEKLVQLMLADPRSAPLPKIRFWEPFVELRVQASIP